MVTLPAHLVATPVLERLTGGSGGGHAKGLRAERERVGREGKAGAREQVEGRTGELEGAVLGAGDTAVWIDLDGFVVVVTTREVPLLPNAIALSAGSGALVGAVAGSRGTARLVPGRVAVGSLQVTWDPAAPPAWDPAVPVPTDASPAAVAARGAAILHALGSGPTPWVEGSQGGVDNPGPRLPGSTTLPVRGPAHPEGGRLQVARRSADPEGGGLEAARRSAEPEGGGLEAARAPANPEGGGLRAAPGPRDSGVAGPHALVRELARIGLATAVDPEGAAALTLLFGAVGERDPELASAAVRDLLGRGPGLTPEGDDLLAGVAGALAVLGPATGLTDTSSSTPPRRALPDGPVLDAMLEALAPIPGRTTALSATLLTLALERRLPEPAGRLLDLRAAGETAWPAALARLERLGHGSGRAYAAGIAATALLLAGPTNGLGRGRRPIAARSRRDVAR